MVQDVFYFHHFAQELIIIHKHTEAVVGIPDENIT